MATEVYVPLAIPPGSSCWCGAPAKFVCVDAPENTGGKFSMFMTCRRHAVQFAERNSVPMPGALYAKGAG